MARPTKTLLGSKARKAVLDGVNAIYEPVRRTLGPQAKKALLYRTFNRGSRIVDDGKTVAECQEPKDIFARLAAESFKETCKKTDEIVGDGTTTTVVIGGKLMNDVYALLTEDHSESIARKISGQVGVMTLRKQILDSAFKVKEAVKAAAKKVETIEELEKIATVSVEDAELGKIIAKMAWEVGVDGFIDVVEGYKGEIETEVIKGMRFPAKVPAKAFVNNPNRFEMVVNDCPVLITNYAIENLREIAKVLTSFNQTGVTNICVISPNFSETVLVDFVNATKTGFRIFPVRVPSLRTDQFEDLSIYCGATFIDKNKGKRLIDAKVTDLGFFEKLIVKDTEAKEDAVVTGGKGTLVEEKTSLNNNNLEKRLTSAIQDRIEVLKGQLKETQQEQYKKLLERRIASMASAVGVIRVGDSTQASSLYRKLKIEDAVYACKAALRGGYVKGGGLCLKEIAETMDEKDILRNAILAPHDQIQASVDGGLVIGPEIIDPAESVLYAVEHATSVVANLATVEIITPEAEDPIMGEGEFAIAKMIGELSIALKRHYGQLKESEEEYERDRLSGLTADEMITLDNG